MYSHAACAYAHAQACGAIAARKAAAGRRRPPLPDVLPAPSDAVNWTGR
jgi:hypothetical protein